MERVDLWRIDGKLTQEKFDKLQERRRDEDEDLRDECGLVVVGVNDTFGWFGV